MAVAVGPASAAPRPGRPPRPPRSGWPGCTGGRSTRRPARVTESVRDERPVEFPTLDDRLVGRASRHLYTVSESAIVHYDEAGPVRTHELGPDVTAGEAVFVPAADDAAENEGWLLSITTRRDGSASRLLVLDAERRRRPAGGRRDVAARGAGRVSWSWIPDAETAATRRRTDDPHPAPRAGLGRRAAGRHLLRAAPARRHRLGGPAGLGAGGRATAGLGRGEAAQPQPVRHRDAAGVRDRAGAHLRQRGPAVPAGQGVVRDRGGGPDLPGHRAARAPAADPGRAAELASRSGRRAGRRVPGRPGARGAGTGSCRRSGGWACWPRRRCGCRWSTCCRSTSWSGVSTGMAVLALGGLAVWTGRYSARARAAAAPQQPSGSRPS